MEKSKGEFYKTAQLTRKYYFSAARNCWGYLLVIFAITAGFKQYFSYAAGLAAMNPKLQMVAALGGGLSDLLATFCLFMTLPPIAMAIYSKEPMPKLSEFYKKHGMPLIIESLRIFVYTFLWLLVLIVPGIVRSLQYIFMPFVVMFDSRYQDDDSFDPITESLNVARGILFRLIAFVLAMMALGMLIDSFSRPGSLGNFAVYVVSFALGIYSSLFYFFLYVVRRDQISADKAQ